ncbi:ATP-binding protein [Actinokineospora sp. NPDC004072]
MTRVVGWVMSLQPGRRVDSESAPRTFTCRLDATSTREVRDLVRGLLADHLGVIVDDAVLVIDELVSNALRHGHAPRTCRLALINHGRCLRVEVDDTAPEQPRLRTPDASGGRGLVLVDRLATTWGVQRYPHHKTVWAEFALNRPGSSGHTPHLAMVPTRPRQD